MSTTLTSLRARVQATLNDMDAKRPLGPIRLDNAIRNAYITLQARLPAAENSTDSAGTISAGADTFSLPTTSSAEYAGLVWLRLRSTGQFLTQLSVEEMNAFRQSKPTPPSGIPQFFALWEDATQTVQGRLELACQTAQTYDLFKTAVAADLDLTSVDTTTIALSRYGIQALIYQSSAEVAASLTPEDLALRRLNPSIIPVWFKQAEVMAHHECVRRHEIEDTGRLERWLP